MRCSSGFVLLQVLAFGFGAQDIETVAAADTVGFIVAVVAPCNSSSSSSSR